MEGGRSISKLNQEHQILFLNSFSSLDPYYFSFHQFNERIFEFIISEESSISVIAGLLYSVFREREDKSNDTIFFRRTKS